MPYGEDIAAPPVANDRTKFATYHRDETGLDYADQRYYSPGTARFLSVDPAGYSDPSESASWNQYSYVQSDPINYKITPASSGYPFCRALAASLEACSALSVEPLRSQYLR